MRDVIPMSTNCQYAILAYFRGWFKIAGPQMKSIHDQSYKLLIASLKAARKGQRLTQAELAVKLGSDQTYVSKVETLERRIDVVELRSICKALSLDFVGFIRSFEEKLTEKEGLAKKKANS
ncbi:MAG: helix-turn-helix transcriptional regulator [Syntrophorhabdales bacterium]|jgi:ribosome-binding protein aMBF1 (putative translation factor)